MTIFYELNKKSLFLVCSKSRKNLNTVIVPFFYKELKNDYEKKLILHINSLLFVVFHQKFTITIYNNNNFQ